MRTEIGCCQYTLELGTKPLDAFVNVKKDGISVYCVFSIQTQGGIGNVKGVIITKAIINSSTLHSSDLLFAFIPNDHHIWHMMLLLSLS